VGYGSIVSTTLTVTSGLTYFITVGGKGKDRVTGDVTTVLSGGYNGGGRSASKANSIVLL
jgi:hypothetical protein